MASSMVRMDSYKGPTTPSNSGANPNEFVTRSGKVRRNLDPNFASNSANKHQAMEEVDYMLVMQDGIQSADPLDLFWFVTPKDLRWLPGFIVADKAMTAVERTKIVLLDGITDNLTLAGRVFCRIEKGIDENFSCHNVRRVMDLFKEMLKKRGSITEAYRDCVARFPDAMLKDYSFPDFGKNQEYTLMDWALPSSQSLLADEGMKTDTQDYFKLRQKEIQSQQQSVMNKQASTGSATNPVQAINDKGKENQTPGAKTKAALKEVTPADNSTSRSSSGKKKKKKRRRSRSRSASSVSSDLDQNAQELIKKSKKKKSKRSRTPTKGRQEGLNSDDDFEPAVTQQTENVEAGGSNNSKGSKPKKANKTTCGPLCQCWGMSEEALLEINENTSAAERDHRILIFQYKVAASFRAKLRAVCKSQESLRIEQGVHNDRLKIVEQFSKTTARDVKFDDRKAKDLETLGLKYVTCTDLKEATETKMDELRRTMTYVEQTESGSKFIDTYFKSVMETSLLYRMYPCDSPMKNKTLTGKLFVFGTEYFRLPEAFQDMIVDYAANTWPNHWNKTKARRKISTLLEYHRKTRACQMRNLIMASVKKRPHQLLFAIAWDNEEEIGLFDSPAPLWGTKQEMDEYYARYEEEWLRHADNNSNLTNWHRRLPTDWTQPNPKSKAEYSILATRAYPEPYHFH